MTSEPGAIGRVLKVIAGTTAVLTFFFAIRQATIFVGDYRDRHRRVVERLATADLQRSARDYRAAWSSLREAATIDPRADTVQRAREALAMDWLEHAASSQGLSLGALGDTMSPVLTRGILDATGTRRADLLAHLGWADFLRSRDGGQVELDPSARYRQALATDSLNPYAHAMLGHWLLWGSPRRPDEARTHFAAALRSGRAGAYVRGLEFAAFANQQSDAGYMELLRVANAMRVANDTIDDRSRGRVYSVISSFLRRGTAPLPPAVSRSVAPGELLRTYRWLFSSNQAESDVETYTFMLARLQEAAGDSADAVTSYRAVRARLGPDDAGYRQGIDSALKRLRR
ncbi:MAG: hypothetical protein ABIP93_08885 [Gemmatimonadaceae bacterium]